MFENLCILPLSSQLFAQALHPTEPVLTTGLAGGHVESFRLPVNTAATSFDEGEISIGTSTIHSKWRTRRHCGSCRTLAYSIDGEGTDGLVKAASSHTGRVFAKIAIPPFTSQSLDAPSLLHALTPQTLILATDSAALYIYDLRQNGEINPKPVQKYYPHEDYITSLTPLPPSTFSTSTFSKQWISTGGTTLSVTDLRKGVISTSEDQGEELLTSVYVRGLPVKPGKSSGEKLILGDSSGYLTLWEKGIWDDQQERIKVAGKKKNSCALESLALIPDDVGSGVKSIVVGIEDGHVKIVNLGPNKISATLQHDEIEPVVALNFDSENRLISGGGTTVKVWQEKLSSDTLEDEGEDQVEKEYESCDSIENNASTFVDEDIVKTQKRRKKKASRSMNKHGIMNFPGMD